MATYDIAQGSIAAHAKSLAAGTADSVVFPHDVEYAEIITDGTHDVYVCGDGSVATAGGGECWRIPAAATAISRKVALNGTTLSIVSASVVVYSVTEVDAVEGIAVG